MDLLKSIKSLTQHHFNNCDLYRWYLESLFPNYENSKSLESLPWLPVRAFKYYELKSIPSDKVFKIMLSSGTSGQQSKIFLDQINAKAQQAKLIEIFSGMFGKKRYPMLVIDSESTVKNRKQFSARTAAINGFTIFSKRRDFALDENMDFDFDRVNKFLKNLSGEKFFVFGFTFVIWEKFIRYLEVHSESVDFSNAFIIHGGGWKKLENEKVLPGEFKERIFEATSCARVYNYFGMIEQTGSIYLECLKGNLHAPLDADFLIRSQETLETLPAEKIGLVQFFSNIQTSYPGHSLLSEDLGFYLPANFCSCGSKGRILKIIGRAKRADIRGCSDAIEEV